MSRLVSALAGSLRLLQGGATKEDVRAVARNAKRGMSLEDLKDAEEATFQRWCALSRALATARELVRALSPAHPEAARALAPHRLDAANLVAMLEQDTQRAAQAHDLAAARRELRELEVRLAEHVVQAGDGERLRELRAKFAAAEEAHRVADS